MLFNSYLFIFGFLPASLLLFHACRRLGLNRGSVLVLTLLSLLFYGWWNPVYLLLIVPLIVVNFGLAIAIARTRLERPGLARLLFITGVAINLGVLGYFKYANFLVDTLNVLIARDSVLAQIVLPLGISFFIFQKIAFLSDVFQGRVRDINLLDFALFVTFFPQLIAGPIVHHSEVLPQFRRAAAPSERMLAMGVTIFIIGLAKKVLLADTAALFVADPFGAAAAGAPVDLLAAWSGALAYTAQLYFDFSGYCDMAIGAALLFGIRLPVNFASPYKADSIIEFWRRWHITLSRFLRDYLYVPLGGNRLGTRRRYLNLFVTMLLGGLWHGAGWTFVVWGGLHGTYLVLNHGWRAVVRPLVPEGAAIARLGAVLAMPLTFLAVVVGWVFFRAADLPAAAAMLRGMAGLNGATSAASQDAGLGLITAAALLLVAFTVPNTQELTGYAGPNAPEPAHAPQPSIRWEPSLRWAAAAGCVFALAVMSLSEISEFLYFQF